MHLLEGFELEEESVQRFEVFGRGGVDVEDGRQGKTQEEVVHGSTR